MEVQPFGVMVADGPVYDRAKEVKEFEETKAGVKGLADSGISKLPRFLIHPPENLLMPFSPTMNVQEQFEVPIIDMESSETSRRKEVVNQIREAAETWGFFQMVNHEIPNSVLENMLEAVRNFHELPSEIKKEWYCRDPKVKVRYFSNSDLFTSEAACWRDSLALSFDGGPVDPETYPQVCREAAEVFSEHIIKLKEAVAELLSESLELPSEYLGSMQCMGSHNLVGNYYPSCPEPDWTLGTFKHTDPSYLTFLLQDNIGGLQVLHQNCWVNVKPIQGAVVVNIGDFMQLLTNDKFKSVEHRVLVGRTGPRVTTACHFFPVAAQRFKPYGPIKEFTSEDNPPIYRETHFAEYFEHFKAMGWGRNSGLPRFKL